MGRRAAARYRTGFRARAAVTARADAPVRGGSRSSAPRLRPFDLSRDLPPGILDLDPPIEAGQGRVVAVRASARARRNDWAAHAAVAIAGSWASRGGRVLLADLFLDEPRLHRAFNTRNAEGIADAILYGASLGRIARPADDGRFCVATAGTPVANPEALLDEAAWDRLLATWVESGVTVLAYQAAASPVRPAGTPSIVLACKGEPMTALGTVGLRDAIALLGPAPGASVARAATSGVNRLGGQVHRVSPWDELDDRGPTADPPVASKVDPSVAQTAEPPVAQAAEPSVAQAAEPSVADSEPPPAAEASVRARPRDGTELEGVAHHRGRGLGIAAFAVLVLFAAVMTLMAIDNAGIADVAGADRLREGFDALLARLSGLFLR